MRLLCALGWHKPSQRIIENEGRVYSRCKRCGVDLIKVGDGWKTAPRGYRVIWKDPDAAAGAETAKPPVKRKPRSTTKGRPAPKKARPRKSAAQSAAAAKAAETAGSAAAGKPADGDNPDSVPAKRRRSERRVAKDAPLPAKLAGKERRRTRNRRQGFGKRPDGDA